MFKKVKRYIQSPYYALGDDLIKTHPERMSDKYYLRVLWKQIMGYPLNLKNPQTFNEKLQWMKLYDRNPLYTVLVDKLKVKAWVADRIGEKYVIPTLSVYNSVDDIDLDSLPNQFVLKCNHDSGGVIICNDKSTFNLEDAKAYLGKRMEQNFYWEYREWPYKDVERKAFSEAFIVDPGHVSKGFQGLRDYKFFCFAGTPRLMYIANDRSETPTTDFFDMDFEPLPIYMKDPKSPIPPSRPLHFDEMKELAAALSKGFRQVRVDFYDTPDGVFFGEMTFFHSAGFSEVHPKEWNLRMGEWIDLGN